LGGANFFKYDFNKALFIAPKTTTPDEIANKDEAKESQPEVRHQHSFKINRFLLLFHDLFQIFEG
jgi:hypothetical protein